MASSVQITLRRKPNKNGQYPLAIRITKNRRSTYKLIGHYIDIEDWDNNNKLVRESHPNSEKLNQLISSKIHDANKRLITLQTKNDDLTATFIKKEIYKSKKKLSFFELAQEHLEELEIYNKHNRLSSDTAYVNYIQRFNKSKELSFDEIDERFLRKLKIYLIKEHSLCLTSIMNVFVFIRLLFNKAIKDKIAKQKQYPFGGNKIKIKFPETEKIGLNADEIIRIETLTNLSHSEIHARNIWLYSFNFAGIRVSDALRTKWSDIKDDRLYYRMGKNCKILSLKLSDKVKNILDYYIKDKRHVDDFIFPELKKANLKDSKDVFNKIKTANKKFNYYLKSIAEKANINKKLTMHIARHSFGNVAGDTIHPLMLQKLYRHSDLKTTINYQANFIHKPADEALESVIRKVG
ncbi:site-specific integrase [Snuella sedimenti]|uniref:Site-specific integrase n=1 Tax=Snuella sedimenti TaxID=2798802 RepID=A0A8J7IVI8_9FLAO|nr:site-specific integrase [Snuella sedimenti]MBJ6367690.1 site-specific integrase [Snuella sedimenti]